MLVTKQFQVSIDFHSMDKKKYYRSQWDPKTDWLLWDSDPIGYQHSAKYSSLLVSHVWRYMDWR